jgi:phosphatidylserine decarboxylase
MSHAVGWAADRRLPAFARRAVFRGYARATGADLSEVRLPLETFPSLAHFFVRELRDGARPIERAPDALVSPVDGTIQAQDRIERGMLLQAKGRSYAVDELLAGMRGEVELEGGQAWTVYLSPRDYHRIHSPETCRVSEVAWVPGERYSVQPSVLARRPVLAINERVVLRLESAHGPFFLVLVGALNVGRMRVVGIEATPRRRVEPPRSFARGAEIARFEMGSTIVLLVPPNRSTPLSELGPGSPVRLGTPLGRWTDAS